MAKKPDPAVEKAIENLKNTLDNQSVAEIDAIVKRLSDKIDSAVTKNKLNASRAILERPSGYDPVSRDFQPADRLR
ncbi:hypothetical protein [Massilia sp. IC2-476]|uniref:hypothetical protein n=1 Tax=Massilia sp. IC2-476 TaxID=2887199 RepID=UPI001D10E3A4|nr:hypothetical protein [Massilia sp. IC2-476]MCC2973584.1 hypothetical protein [Massilia sp. IC2-476]